MTDTTKFLFVYGTLRHRFEVDVDWYLIDSLIISDAVYRGEYRTSPVYDLLGCNDDRFPGMFENSKYSVAGSIFEIAEEDFEFLDYYEHVPHYYERKPVHIPLFTLGTVYGYVGTDHLKNFSDVESAFITLTEGYIKTWNVKDNIRCNRAMLDTEGGLE